MESCGRCRDPKNVLVEKMPANRSNSGPVAKNPPMRFTTCKKEPKANPISKARPIANGGAAAAAA